MLYVANENYLKQSVFEKKKMFIGTPLNIKINAFTSLATHFAIENNL